MLPISLAHALGSTRPVVGRVEFPPSARVHGFASPSTRRRLVKKSPEERSPMTKMFIAAGTAALLAISSANAEVITQWTFEGDTTVASAGSGTASLIGGTTATFAAGFGGGRGWNTTTYKAQGVGSGDAGVQFLVGTASGAGFENIQVSFDHRASGTASRWAQVDYTLDAGTTWVTGFWNNAAGLSPHDNFYSFTVDFSSVTGANNNANFGFRIVSIFSPVAFNQNSSISFGANAAYMRANADATFEGTPGVGTGNYAAGGTWRFDNVTVSGSAIPAPGALALLGAAALAGVRRRR